VIFAGPIEPGAVAAATPRRRRRSEHAVFDAGAISGLGARNIGSATMSGRIAAVAGGVSGARTLLFVGAASGGVCDRRTAHQFKPGVRQATGAVDRGDRDHPSNPKTIWVGTARRGPATRCRSAMASTSRPIGGDTWTHTGLAESEHIVRILVHPAQSQIVYACVPASCGATRPIAGCTGPATAANLGAGLKGPNPSTGCSSVTMDPGTPTC